MYFTIVIPTYNRSNLLGDTLQSALNQTFKDFEIIVIDDGSTDNTEDFVKSNFSYANLHYFKQKNSERGIARNNGFRRSSGKFVVFFDSDDLMLPHHLASLHAAIEKHPQFNFYATKHQLLNGNIVKKSVIYNLKSGAYNLELFLKGNPLACNICVRKNNNLLILFPEDRAYSIMEDWMFIVSNLKNGPIYISEEATIVNRDHPERSMNSSNDLIIKKRLLATAWIIKNVNLNKNEILDLYYWTFYFCAIHSYIDGSRIQVIRFLSKGLGSKFYISRLFISLFFKSLVGQKWILKTKITTRTF